MKIATWNVNSLRVRLDQVLAWLEHEQPDVLALQETKTKDEDFPVDALTLAGYKSSYSGQATYNGVALITRSAMTDVHTELDGFDDPQRRVLAATVSGVRVLNLYVPNGQRVDSDKYAYKLRWLAAVKEKLRRTLTQTDNCVVLGDFNIAPEDRDVHDPVAWEGKVLVSEPERAALAEITDLGFVDLFRRFDQPEQTFSWWDYRAGGFRRNRGLRIDLILATQAMSETCTGCRVDTGPRGHERPSDHTPVIAEFAE